MQGSFWSAFGSRLGAASSNAIDEILERPDVTLEDVLDCEDLIQEGKYKNAQLTEFVSQPHVIEKLIRYIITLPGDEPVDSNSITNSSHNHSKSSVEAFIVNQSYDRDAEHVEHVEFEVHPSSMASVPEDAVMNDKSQDISNSNSPSDDEFSTTYSLNSTTVAPVEPKDRENFLKYPYLASELFACEVPSMLDVLFELPDLLHLLFSFLDHSAPIDPAHVSYFRKVMVVLIQHKYEPLVRYIQEHGIIDKLVQHIGLYSIMEILIMIGWDDGLGQVNDVNWLYTENLIPKLVSKLTPEYESQTDVHMNAARALVDVVVKCPPTDQNVLISHLQSSEVLSDIFSCMFSGSLSSLTNSMSIIIVLVQRFANRRIDVAAEVVDANGALTNSQLTDDGELEEPFASLAPHLHRIIALLEQPQQEVRVQFGNSQPFGETRMKVVELTLVLLRSRLSAVDAQLADLRVLSLMLDALFDYPWNNMLHGLIESIVRTVLESESPVLRKALFEDTNLTDRFIDAYHRGEAAGAKQGGYRLGYMGHLIRTAMAVEETARKSDELRAEMHCDSERWMSFVSVELEREHTKQQQSAPAIPFEQQVLDGIQFDLGSLASQGSYGGRGEYGDEEGTGTAYDYSGQFIRDPDTDYDENGEPISHDDNWGEVNQYGGFVSTPDDDWSSFGNSQFPTFSDIQGSFKSEFDRPTATDSRRTLASFESGGDEDESDEFTVHSDEPHISAQTSSFDWPPTDFNADFDADFDAFPTSSNTSDASFQQQNANDVTSHQPAVDDFEADFPAA